MQHGSMVYRPLLGVTDQIFLITRWTSLMVDVPQGGHDVGRQVKKSGRANTCDRMFLPWWAVNPWTYYM